MIRDQTPWDGLDMEVEPPGFEWDGPKTGSARCKGAESKYDTERENEGATHETAVLHTQDPEERKKIRELLKKHRNLFSKSNYDIGNHPHLTKPKSMSLKTPLVPPPQVTSWWTGKYKKSSWHCPTPPL